MTSKEDGGVDICRKLLAKYPVTDTKTRFCCRSEHLCSQWRVILKEERFLKDCEPLKARRLFDNRK